MYENDYIMRVIMQIGAMLRAMLSGNEEQHPEEVLETSGKALQLLLGLPPTTADSLTPEGLVALLSTEGAFDAKRGRLAAEVFVRRVQAGAMMPDRKRTVVDRRKAALLITLTIENGDEEDVAEARALAKELELGEVST